MAKDRSLVRASDIGFWSFCHRAWWLANVKKIPHRNPTILQHGHDTHDAHARTVLRAGQLHRLGLFAIVLSLILLGLLIILSLFFSLHV
ncbi:hypothetical protein KFU94_51210 [Chloroflexi bacterium TSY]|nr:hypothetical protein [Chloroflexi bacterium TSY]